MSCHTVGSSCHPVVIYHAQQIDYSTSSVQYVVHKWLCRLNDQQVTLAHLEVDLASHSIKQVKSFEHSGLPHLVGKMLTDLLIALKYSMHEKIPYTPFEPLFSHIALCDMQQFYILLDTWLNRGGDPNIVLKNGHSKRSLLLSWIDNWNEWAKKLIDHGLDTQHLEYSDMTDTGPNTCITTLALQAVGRNALGVLEHIVDKQIDVDYPTTVSMSFARRLGVQSNITVYTPIVLGLINWNYQAVELLLQGNANPNQIVDGVPLSVWFLRKFEEEPHKTIRILTLLFHFKVNPIPVINLMLHILVTHQGVLEPLVACMQQLVIPTHYFSTLDTRGQSLFHKLRDVANLVALQQVVGKEWQTICAQLIDQPDHANTTPLGAAVSAKRWALAQAFVTMDTDPNIFIDQHITTNS